MDGFLFRAFAGGMAREVLASPYSFVACPIFQKWLQLAL